MTQDENSIVGQFDALLREVTALRKEVARVDARLRDIRSLVGPFGLVMPDGTVLVQTLFGTKYFIDPTDMIIAPNLIIYRQWEANISAFLSAAATPDTVFVDVGANFGYFTCLVGSRIGNKGQGRVFAIEPNPAMAALLRRNISINWSMAPIVVHECAAAENNGTANLFVPAGRASNASLSADVPTKADEPFAPLVVSTRRLDSIISEGCAVDLMKIDVEGHEYAALRGSERLINQSPDITIVIEWSQPQMKTAGYSVAAMLDILDGLELQPHMLPVDRQPKSVSLSPLTRDQLSALTYENLVLRRKLK